MWDRVLWWLGVVALAVGSYILGALSWALAARWLR